MMASVVRGKFSLAQPAIPRGTRGVATSFSAGWVIRLPRSKPINLYSRAYNAFQHGLPRLARLFGFPRGNLNTTNFPHRLASIQQRLSFSSRIALSRPLRAPGMPRPQTLARPVHEVGLGTARRFSSQSTFQHVVENVSIGYRAFWEVDWTLRPDDIRHKQVHRQDFSQGTDFRQRSNHPISDFSSYTNDLERYFPLPATKESTIVDLSLEPITIDFMPSAISRESLQLLPFQDTLDNHIRFQVRNAEIRAVLTALDEANAWANGVTVRAIGDASGLCTILRVYFQGWTLDQVQSLLGPLLDVSGCHVQRSVAPYDHPPHLNNAPDPESFQPLDFIMPKLLDCGHQDNDLFNDEISDHGLDDGMSVLSLTSSCDMTREWPTDYHIQNQVVLLSSDFLSKIPFSE
ncbi:hypothetical protein FS842_000422 [Serendipita sp. 407]|nr:hypothetical protein FS842_000422 [Serendipita sp. 407]